MRTAIGVTGDAGRAVVGDAPRRRARDWRGPGRYALLLVRDSPSRPKGAVVTIEWGRELRRNPLGPPSTTLPR